MIAIRPAREDDYDEIARVWFEGYLASSYGETPPPEITEAYLRARIPGDIADRGWQLYAAEKTDAWLQCWRRFRANGHWTRSLSAMRHAGAGSGGSCSNS
jgi:hypothetical protein